MSEDIECPECHAKFKPTRKTIEKKKTDLQRIIEAYKHSKGIAMDNKAWDKACFPRYSRAGKSLLSCFAGDLEKSAAYLFLRAEQLNEIGCEWTLDTIVKHAWDGMGIPKEESDGKQHSSVGSAGLPGSVGHRRIASAREIAGETIRAIESSVIHPKGAPRLEGLGMDSMEDHEPFE